jgi:hypothetical protein
MPSASCSISGPAGCTNDSKAHSNHTAVRRPALRLAGAPALAGGRNVVPAGGRVSALYIWVVISLLVLLNLHLKLRGQIELITALARHVAIATAAVNSPQKAKPSAGHEQEAA